MPEMTEETGNDVDDDVDVDDDDGDDNGDDNDFEWETVETVEEAIEQDPFVEVFGTPTRARILAVMVDASRPLNPHDIVESAAISRNAFYENWGVLEEYGIVEQAGTAGNSPLYQLSDSELAESIARTADLAGAAFREQRFGADE